MSKTSPADAFPSRPTPKQIKALGKAVARALRRLDDGLAEQRGEILGMAQQVVRASVEAVRAARELRDWPRDDAPAVDDAVLARLEQVVRASFAALRVEPERPDELDELASAAAAAERAGGEEAPGSQLAQAAVQAVSMGWANAVSAHQQQAALAEAALNQGLTLLFSLAGDALTEKQELRLDALARAASERDDTFEHRPDAGGDASYLEGLYEPGDLDDDEAEDDDEDW